MTDLLLRNALEAFAATIWFTPLVVQLACASLAAAWGAVAGAGYYVAHSRDGTAQDGQLGTYSAVLGVLVGLVT